jgi:hypothetical protein
VQRSALCLVDGHCGFDVNFDGMITLMFSFGTGEQAPLLSTLPLFVYAGYLLADSKAGDRLVRVEFDHRKAAERLGGAGGTGGIRLEVH